jgi:hypothetical protein
MNGDLFWIVDESLCNLLNNILCSYDLRFRDGKKWLSSGLGKGDRRANILLIQLQGRSICLRLALRPGRLYIAVWKR